VKISRILKLVLLFASSTALVFAQGQGKHLGATQAKGIGGFGLGGPQLERLAEFLNLTDQQLQDAKAIFEAARVEEEKIETQAGDVQQQIQDLIRTSTSEFDSKIQALLTAYTTAETQELAIKTRAMNRFWNLLTPEQQQKASELEKFLKAPKGKEAGSGSGEENGDDSKTNGKK
jgi:Spy/CpxP family protein refolding chaperone